MRRRVNVGVWTLCLSLIAFASLSALSLTTTAWGQVSIVAGDVAAAVHELLDRGQSLESQRRWGEALAHYEEALRQYPAERNLEQRLELSRIHYDLGRRYSDQSFRQAVAAMSGREALDLYAEVLLKIQAHYVESPDWVRLVGHGATHVQVALSDPLFVEANLPALPPAEIDRFRRLVRGTLAASAIPNRHAARDVAASAARLAREHLGLAEAAVLLEYTCGATNALDPYSTYLTAAQLNDVYSQIEGNFVGLGIELKASEASLVILKVIPGSPAERVGIRPGDRIVAVDGRSTEELSTDQAANLLQGSEGSWVEVTAVAPAGPPRRVRVRREHVEVPSVDDARLVDAEFGIAYLKLTCFQKTTSRDLDAALWKLHRAGMKCLVIDLRGNPGGLLTTAVDVADKFVDRGVIVSTRGRSPEEDYNYAAHESGTWRVPLVVLIDGDSASASEIFAGAIRDHQRGTLVGTRSYGKGSVQGIFPLNLANSGLRLTTARFYSPKGRPYNQVGVEPHLLVQYLARPVHSGQGAEQPRAAADAALDAALAEARRQLARR